MRHHRLRKIQLRTMYQHMLYCIFSTQLKCPTLHSFARFFMTRNVGLVFSFSNTHTGTLIILVGIKEKKEKNNTFMHDQISNQHETPSSSFTFIRSALLSISWIHFLMMKGTPSKSPCNTWEKSRPNSCNRPCSFLWPHWIARDSRHFLWQARKHYNMPLNTDDT